MRYNQDYQRQLAETLVEGCGIKGAIEFAQQNNWEGVLAQIIAVGGRRHDWEEDDRRNGEPR